VEGLREADFIDGHHMLREGAARYSRRLAEERLGPWLARSELTPRAPARADTGRGTGTPRP
jgi:hypothetical protein